MTTVAYLSPFVPPEWIAAFGWRPRWLRLARMGRSPWAAGHRGLCPLAGAMTEALLNATDLRAVVLTTTCDPMRYAAALLETRGGPATFLLNVPSTWQTPAAGRLYREELSRLGRFLVRLGGHEPTDDSLRATLLRYDQARAAARESWHVASSGQYAELLDAVRSDGRLPGDCPDSREARMGPSPSRDLRAIDLPLALLGGPLLEDDLVLLDSVTSLGGRIVLDGSEGGERTLPAPLDLRTLAADPLAALEQAYFGAIPDVFRRPNTALFAWLGREIPARGVRGILLRRHVFCDPWHAEVERLRTASGVPLLDLDTLHAEDGSAASALGRIEAVFEMLRGGRSASVVGSLPRGLS